MPYFPILQKPTQNNLITKTSFRRDAPSPSEKTAEERIAPSSQYTVIGEKPPKSGLINVTLGCPIGAIHRHRRKNRRRAVSYVSTGLARLPRDANTSTIYRRRAVVETSSLGLHSLVAERRHSSVTRYAKRSVACRDSPRQQPLRAGDALLRRPRKRSRLQLTPDRVGGTRTDAYAPRSAAAERSIAKCRKLGRR